ncbi:Ryanodine receptor [Brachionus plicatilis]|uniref:Ryanodine receptor n=1 Tax=Brachionus plicatilis TaxID=10195 RepID=A0A3M7R0S9_BRAPC|nr:Ryanodine receptor [Brachionus plicatilis]
MASIEDKQSNGEPDDLSFLRTEDYICLNCSVVTQNGISRRMALAAEAFGNKMCFLEDITLENVTPDFPACIFVLEQALSVRALQEFVNSSENSNLSII